ncbi:MAG: hypothetical protein K0U41_06830 [Gammaproteobacteria bacterium]|nr:hypothetical protein [Gammaproteobacteria bacterium]
MSKSKKASSPVISIDAVQLEQEIKCCIASRVVPYVTSSPGIGKSQIVAKIAKERDLELIDIRLSTAQPEDLSGYPSKITDPITGKQKAEFIPFSFFPTVEDHLPLNEKGKKLFLELQTKLAHDKTLITQNINTSTLTPENQKQLNALQDQFEKDEAAIRAAHSMKGWLILFDELSSAAKAMQAAAYKIILDRQIGQFDLHENAFIVAAGNRMEDNSVVFEMSKALASRMVHYELRSDVAAWLDWAFKAGINSKVITFLNSSHGHLSMFDPDDVDRTFPCPRTWEMLSKLLDNSPEASHQIPVHRIGGVVGNAAANTFYNYCQYYLELPEFIKVVADPKNTNVPSDHAKKFAMSDMLATNEQLDHTNIAAIISYVKRLPTDMQANFVNMASRVNPKLTSKPSEPATPLETLAAQVIVVAT